MRGKPRARLSWTNCWVVGEHGLMLGSPASVSLSESVVWLRLGVGEARLGMDTEEKNGKESGS